jgi:hypothetical protein
MRSCRNRIVPRYLSIRLDGGTTPALFFFFDRSSGCFQAVDRSVSMSLTGSRFSWTRHRRADEVNQ